MFVTIMHGHDRITLCAHVDFRAHIIILLRPCIVMTRFRDEIIRKKCAKIFLDLNIFLMFSIDVLCLVKCWLPTISIGTCDLTKSAGEGSNSAHGNNDYMALSG